MYQRALENILVKNLKGFAAIYVNGPRQSGKSTLVKKIAKEHLDADYITFDDPFIMANAKEDPHGFLEQFNKSIVLDEVQMVPELFRLLKMKIDKNKELGIDKKNKIILTGSTNIMALPKLADALVGRIAIHTLYPISAAEIYNKDHNFIENIFSGALSFKKYKKFDISNLMQKATFPELSDNNNIDKKTWFNSYITTIIERDIRQLTNISQFDLMPRLLQILAGRAGCILNDSDVASSLNIDNNRIKRYRTLLEKVFLTFRVPAWFSNTGKRFIKAPKLYFTDTLLLSFLLGIDIEHIKNNNKAYFGHLFENFVATELLKQLSLLSDGALYHFRVDRKEVDFIIQKRNEDLIGVEVKAKSNVGISDIKGLIELQEFAGNKFKKGIVLYLGDTTHHIKDNIWAVPIEALCS